MKIFVHVLIIVATLVLGGVASADEKAHVITGRVVELAQGYNTMFVQSGKERVEINFSDVKFAGNAKAGDAVRVHYTTGHHVYRADPDNEATKIEVIAGGASKK